LAPEMPRGPPKPWLRLAGQASTERTRIDQPSLAGEPLGARIALGLAGRIRLIGSECLGRHERGLVGGLRRARRVSEEDRVLPTAGRSVRRAGVARKGPSRASRSARTHFAAGPSW